MAGGVIRLAIARTAPAGGGTASVGCPALTVVGKAVAPSRSPHLGKATLVARASWSATGVAFGIAPAFPATKEARRRVAGAPKGITYPPASPVSSGTAARGIRSDAGRVETAAPAPTVSLTGTRPPSRGNGGPPPLERSGLASTSTEPVEAARPVGVGRTRDAAAWGFARGAAGAAPRGVSKRALAARGWCSVSFSLRAQLVRASGATRPMAVARGATLAAAPSTAVIHEAGPFLAPPVKDDVFTIGIVKEDLDRHR